MRVIGWGLCIFFLSFFLHLLIWKVYLPKRQTKVLLQIFFGTLIFGFLIVKVTSNFIQVLVIYTPNDFLEYLHISLFFISLTLAYMITYSAIEVDSPSLIMIMMIAEAGSEGLNEKEFEQTMTDDLLIKPRISDLVIDKVIYLEGDKYMLTSKGFLMARIFIIYRKILSTGKGG